MRILVLGAGGQIGRELIRAGRRAQLQIAGFRREQIDITNADSVARAIEASQPELIVNAAAYTAVDKAETDVDGAFSVNCEGARIVAEACARVGIPLVHFSTDYVFDGSKPTPYIESDPPRPLGAYGKSKLAGEVAVRATTSQHVILRTSWVYAAHGHNFVRTMLRLGTEKQRLTVVNDQQGCPTAAADMADAVVRIAPRLADASDAPFGTYHCAGRGSTTWYGFACEIFRIRAELTGQPSPEIAPVPTSGYPTACPRPANSALDCARFGHVFGFALKEWRQSLREVMIELSDVTDRDQNQALD